MKYWNLLDTIWNTPIIKLEKILDNKNINLYAKLEWQNPWWSIKDRNALYMINEAEKKGYLKKWQIILEATSWNMWIALSVIWAQKWYEVHIVMSEAMSQERKTMLRALGAKLILTDKNLGTQWAINKAKELINESPSFYWFADQFNNEDNVDSHYHWVATELLNEVPNIDYIIAWIWTSWTIMWIAKKFKEESPKTKIIWLNPPAGYKIQWIQNPNKDFSWNIFNEKILDWLFDIWVEDAYNMSRKVAQKEGLFVWMSSGASLFAANEISKNLKSWNIVIIIPDRWEKYLSTELFS